MTYDAGARTMIAGVSNLSKAFSKFAASGVLSGQPITSTSNLGKFKNAVLAGSVKVAFVGHSHLEGQNQNWRGANLSRIIEIQLRRAFPDVTFVFANLSLGGRYASQFASGTYVGAANDSAPSTSFFRGAASANNTPETWITPDLSINGSTIGKSWVQHVKDFGPDLIFVLHDLNETAYTPFVTAMNTIMDDFQTAANWGGSAPSVVLGTSATGAQKRPLMLEIHRAIRAIAARYKVPYFDAGRIYELLVTGKDHANFDVAGEAGFRYNGGLSAAAAFNLAATQWSMEGGFTSSSSTVISPTGTTVRANPNTADFRAYRKRPAYDGRVRCQFNATSSAPYHELYARRDPANAFNLAAEQYTLRLAGSTLSLIGYYNGANNTLATATVPTAIANTVVTHIELECIGGRIRGLVNGKEFINIIDYNVQHEGWWGVGQPVNGQGTSLTVGTTFTNAFWLEFFDPASVFASPLCTHADLLGTANDFAANPDSVGGNGVNHLTTAANLFIYQQAIAPVMRTLQAAVSR